MSENAVSANHMEIYWHDYAGLSGDTPIRDASLQEKASVIGRTGLIMLSCGTGAWRVRSAMNSLSQSLGLTCTADIGLMSINCTFFDGKESLSQSLCLSTSGVNTTKLSLMEGFVKLFDDVYLPATCEEVHKALDDIVHMKGNYTPLQLGLAAAVACCAFTFLLGGGPVEMIGAFFGAGVGNYIRAKLSGRKLTLLLCIVASISAACLTYFSVLTVAETLFHISVNHEVGYICAVLFIIPGFPFITSFIDMAKLDLRSGTERLLYALITIVVATLTAWIMAFTFHYAPGDFMPLTLQPLVQFLLRLLASFCGVFGFSLMFNSDKRLAFVAALIGAVSNTLRLELVDFTAMPPAAAAFLGALTAGILASILNKEQGYPRITITVPSIVIMVPGLYLYRGVYNLGIMNMTEANQWLTAASLIVLALPLGLIFARILTDKDFRYCS